MLRLSQLKLPLDHSQADLEAAVVKRLRLQPGELLGLRLAKRSVDARRKPDVYLVYSLDVELAPAAEQALLARAKADPQLTASPDTAYRFLVAPVAVERLGLIASGCRPVVIGAGPCGYFAALLLAQMVLRPLLLERGQAVKQRSADTFGFWRGEQPFNPESNAQLG